MRHLSLFTGVGAFEYAAQTVWGDEWEPVLFCENDEFCQKVLKKHWPDVPIHSDIKDLDCEEDQGTIDLLTGGFPCQPYSVAGKQKGAGDDRALWPEMLRIIQEGKPTWVIGENVAGFINMGLDDCIVDLEAEGYEVQPLIIPACAVDACHRRDRVWIVAYKNTEQSVDGVWPASNTKKTERKQPGRTRTRHTGVADSCFNSTDTHKPGLAVGESQPSDNGKERQATVRDYRGEHWYEVATRLCRVDDGATRGVDRTARLKALGNTIQWEVAAAIMQAIKRSDT